MLYVAIEKEISLVSQLEIINNINYTVYATRGCESDWNKRLKEKNWDAVRAQSVSWPLNLRSYQGQAFRRTLVSGLMLSLYCLEILNHFKQGATYYIFAQSSANHTASSR